MKQRYYIAPVIFKTGDHFNYWGSKINDLINVSIGEFFQEYHQDARRYSLCLVTAEDATHTVIASDPDIIVASPLFIDDADRIAKMDQQANITAVKTRLEAIGLNTDWLTGTESYKDILRYVIQNYFLGQRISATNTQHMKDLITSNLTTQVKDIPLATRTKVAEWMTNNGLATNWITATTTVRQIIHYIITQSKAIVIPTLGDNF